MAAAFGRRQSFGQVAIERPRLEVTAAVPDVPSNWPVLTTAIAFVLTAIFAAQQSTHYSLTLDLRALVAWGGVDRYLVEHEHEWWRILTAPWLHGSLDHLIGNLITLVVAGTILERRIGVCWLALIYFAGGIGGSIASMLYSHPTIVGVGASGAIMALVTAVYALSYHASLERHARKLRRAALFVLIPAVAPAAAHGGPIIDVGAHFGGFVVGIVSAFALLILWNEAAPMPPGRVTAGTIAAAGAAAALAAFVLVGTHYQIYRDRSAALTPIALLNDEDALKRDAYALSRRYPHDPVPHLLLAVEFMNTHHFADAEDQARSGLAERDMLATQFGPGIEQRLETALAFALLGQGRKDEAEKTARPVCGSGEPDLVKALFEADLC